MHFEDSCEAYRVLGNSSCRDCGGDLVWQFVPKPKSQWIAFAKFIVAAAIGWCVYWIVAH